MKLLTGVCFFILSQLAYSQELRSTALDGIPPEIKPFLAKVQSVIEKYDLNKNVFYNSMSGSGFSCGYQFYVPTDKESKEKVNPSNRLVLGITFPAPINSSVSEKPLTDMEFYSHTSHLNGDKFVYWSLTNGKNIPMKILDSFKVQLK